MIGLLLSSNGGFQIFLIVVSLFVIAFILGSVYNKITEVTKMDDDTAGCGWPIFLVLVAIIVGVLMNMKSCSCSDNFGSYDGTEYQYRHTDRIK